MSLRRLLPLVGAAALIAAGCADGLADYRVVITEQSGAITEDHPGMVFGFWSCDLAADPATRDAQDALWTSVDGSPDRDELEFTASCPAGSLLTVQADALATPVNEIVVLRCEVYDSAGQRVGEKTTTLELGTETPVCRVPVPA